MSALIGILQKDSSSFSGDSLTPLAEDAARHGLSGYVLHLVEQRGVPLPEPIRLTLARDSRMVAAQTLRVKLLLLRALDAMHGRGITPVLLKGYGLGLRFYPDPLYRVTSDVDLLVSPSVLAEAERAVEELGLSRAPKETEDWSREFRHHLNFYGPAGMVELHFHASASFGAEMAADPMLVRARPGVVEGRTVLYLRPEDEVAYLATHAAGHALQRLAWLVDIQRLIEATPGLDWDEVASVAEQSDMRVPTFLGLWATHHLLGANVPATVLDRLSPGLWREAIARRVFTEEALVSSWVGTHHRYWSYALQAIFSSGLRNSFRYLKTAAARAMIRKFEAAFPRSEWRT